MISSVRRSATAIAVSRRSCRYLSSSGKPKVPPIRSKQPSGNKKPKNSGVPEEEYVDPQVLSDNRIAQNVGNLSGIEAVEALPAEVHMRNYATAAGLVGFVLYVWWYSMNSVGKSSNNSNSSNSDPLANLRAEAEEARQMKQKQAVSEQEAEELAQLDMGVSEKDLEKEGVTLAVAAPDAIATEEESQNEDALKSGSQRPLWRRIVFFWK